MNLFIVDSLFEPVEIEIGGVVYRSKRMGRKVFASVVEFEKRAGEGDVDALYEQLALMIDAPQEVIDELDFEQVARIARHIMDERQKKIKGPGEEKNVPTPGETPTP